MAIELYIIDSLSVADRFAVEAKRIRALKTELPKGFEIGGQLEARMEQANGFSSKVEMLDALVKMDIPYAQNSNNFNYQYKLLVPEDQIKIVKELVEKSGYATLTKPSEHGMPPAKQYSS